MVETLQGLVHPLYAKVLPCTVQRSCTTLLAAWMGPAPGVHTALATGCSCMPERQVHHVFVQCTAAGEPCSWCAVVLSIVPNSYILSVTHMHSLKACCWPALPHVLLLPAQLDVPLSVCVQIWLSVALLLGEGCYIMVKAVLLGE